MRLSDEQRLDWLRLIRSQSVGPRTFRSLIARFGEAAAALEALPGLARRAGKTVRIATRAEAEREMAAAARLGARYVAMGEPEYARALQAVDTAPPLIALRGNPEAFARPGVAIVGSRNASAAGLAFTERLARTLGDEGFTIVSGLARGIDARAHKASLLTGTVAVLAGGHDRIYPENHTDLVAAILDHGGAVVAEMPMGWAPRGRDFPRRNRLVSGLAYGTVVVEAARRSGSLITARLALEQGREVFAVPGSPLDPRAEGPNDLIRQGATLCAAPEHVAQALAPLLAQGRSGVEAPPPAQGRFALEERPDDWDEFDAELAEPAALGEPTAPVADEAPATDDPERLLVGLMSPAPMAMDDLARLSGLPVRTVHTLLFELELAGRIERHGAGAVSLRPLP